MGQQDKRGQNNAHAKTERLNKMGGKKHMLERETEGAKAKAFQKHMAHSQLEWRWLCSYVCVCVCVCANSREGSYGVEK